MHRAPVARAAILAALLMGVSGSGGEAAMPLTPEEVYAFLLGYGAAMKRCDADWLEAHHLPDAQLLFETENYEPVTLSVHEYYEWFRSNCWHVSQSFDSHQAKVTVSGSTATVWLRSKVGRFTYFFFLSPVDVESIEDTLELIRHGENQIRMSGFRQFLVPAPVEAPASGAAPWDPEHANH